MTDINNNNFTGCVPDTSNLPNLSAMSLGYNYFEGVSLWNPIVNIALQFGNNNFGTPVPSPFRNNTNKINPCAPVVYSVDTAAPTSGGEYLQ